MKMLLTIMTLIFALSAMAIDGEVTGHFMTPFSSVKSIITEHQTIQRSEIEAVTFKPNSAQVIGNIESLRHHGQYITKEDIKGVTLK